MNLTINPIKFNNIINNRNTKPNLKSINSYCKNYENSSNNAIKSYAQALIVMKGKTPSTQTKQILNGNEFFIHMYGYKQDKIWAEEMTNLTYAVSKAISYDIDFNTILSGIEQKIKKINTARTKQENNSFCERRNGYHSFTIMANERGHEYLDRYIKKSKIKNVLVEKDFKTVKMHAPKANEEYSEANVSKIGKIQLYKIKEPVIEIYQDSVEKYTISNLSLVKKEFNKLRAIENPTTEEVLRSCAIIQWLIAQETPYQRGSDSVANVLTKAIMHANNIYISPLKEGVSLDFEAFDTDLDDYIERYPDFFEVRPYKIEG